MRKVSILLLSLVMLVSLLAGCAANNPASTPAPDTSSGSPTPDDSAAPKDWSSYPTCDGTVTLTAWWPTNNSLIDDPLKTLPFIEGSKRTGINWTFTVPVNGSEPEQFNIMLASNEYDDVIKNFASLYNGGYDAAFADEIIIPLEDYAYAMPDYYNWLSKDEARFKASMTDSGHLPALYSVGLVEAQGYRPQGAWNGYGIRADWLENLGLDVPRTYDEIAAVCEAFKDSGYCQYPFQLDPGADPYALMGGYNIVSVNFSMWAGMQGWMLDPDDGKVTFALYQESYRDYVQMLRDWISLGYIAPDFYTVTGDTWGNTLTLATTNQCGMFNFMNTWYSNFTSIAEDPNFDIAPVPTTRISINDKVHVKSASSGLSPAACVTSACDNVEMACSFFNYFFTEEGIILGNYGIEGEHFNYVDGKPVYTDAVRKLTEEHDSSYMQGMLFVFQGPGLKLVDREYMEMSPEAYSFLSVWDSYDFCDSTCAYPPNTTMTAEESNNLNTIMGDINTLIAERLIQFIVGDRDMSEWDAFIQQLKDMNLDETIKIKQDAYDRYLAR